MRRLLAVITIALLATPVFAQDDFGGGLGGALSQSEIDSLLGGGGRGGGRGGRGGQQNIQSVMPDPVVMFGQLKDLLKNKKVPLAKDQEKPLQTLLNTETAAVKTALETEYPALRPDNQNNQNQNNQNRGNQNNNTQAVRINTIVLNENAALLTEMKAALTPEQVALIDKAEKDKKCLVMLDGHLQFLNGGQRGNGVTNERTWCTYGDFTPTKRLDPVREVLSKGKKPLTADEEKKLVALVEARLPLLEKALRDEGVLNNNNQNRGNQNNQNQQLANNIVNQIFQQLGIQNNNNQNPNFQQIIQQACAPGADREQILQQLGGRGPGNIDQLCTQFAQGGNRGNRGNNVNFNTIQTQIQKHNEVILDKVIAMLKPDQQSIIKRFKYDQIKQKGGSERIRAILEEEGTPLTPEQAVQIQNLFNESNQSLRPIATQLVQQAMQATPPPPQAQQPQQNQQNRNGTQTPNPLDQYRQQIVSQVLPKVSTQRGQLENVTMNNVLKVLTPSQVASYKINTTLPPL